jgi:histidine triad (HIT) family protein
MSDCVFCRILDGQLPASFVYRDERCAAFLDIQPVNPGHLLVVPRTHYESLEDIPHTLATHLFEVAMQLAPVVKHVGNADGLNILVNSGAAAGQDVFHYHVHVIPRNPDDGFDVPLPFAASQMPDRTVLDANAARIIATLRDPVALRPDRRGTSEDRRAPSR